MNKRNAKVERMLSDVLDTSGVRWYHKLDWWWSEVDIELKILGSLMAILVAVMAAWIICMAAGIPLP